MTFEAPQMLIALALIPVLAGLYALAQRRRRAYTVRFTNLDLLQKIAGPGPGFKRHVPPMLYLVGAAILLTGLARPQAVMRVPRQQAAVMLAVDISGSMSAPDMSPTRLKAAEAAAKAFVDGLPQDLQVGLVAFRDKANTSIALTRDHEIVKRGIDQLESGGGTAIGEAIFTSLDALALRDTDENGKPGPAIIVLLTDGESNAGRPPLAAAQVAESKSIPIYTIGIGQRGQKMRLSGGQIVGLDENTLKAISEATNAEYFYAAQTDKLTQLYQDLSSRVAWVNERTEITAYVSGVGTFLFLIGAVLSLYWFQQFP